MEIFYLLAELVPCLLFGFLLGRFKANLSVNIAKALINYGIPMSLMGILLKSGLELPLIKSAGIALLSISILMTILNRLTLFRKHIPNRTLQLGSVFGNTGYFGIPVSLALLPNEALIYSIGFDLGATLIIWSIGPLFLKVKSKDINIREYITTFTKVISNSPAVKGLIGATIIQFSPWNNQITSVLWLPSRIVIVLALLIVGMRLGFLRENNFSKIKYQFISVKNALILKLFGFPSIMLILSLIIKLPSIMKNALVLQAAAPTAISVLLISQAESKNEDKAASLVIFSTLAALITIPMWGIILKL